MLHNAGARKYFAAILTKNDDSYIVILLFIIDYLFITSVNKLRQLLNGTLYQ